MLFENKGNQKTVGNFIELLALVSGESLMVFINL